MAKIFLFLLRLIALLLLAKQTINIDKEKRLMFLYYDYYTVIMLVGLGILLNVKRSDVCPLKALTKSYKSILDKEVLRLHMEPFFFVKNIIILYPMTPIYYIDAGEAMRFERLRFATFVDPRARRLYEQGFFFTRLAQNGFYYNAMRDEVLCYTCDCSHMQGHDQNCDWHVDNEPFHQVPGPQPADSGGDVLRNVIRRQRPVQESSEHREVRRQDLPESSLNEDGEHASQPVTGEQVLGGAVYPGFNTFQSRLASFQNWSGVTTPSPIMFATSGFFYAGRANYVRCFYCGVGLNSWDNHSALLTEHLRRSPSCEFQQITQGRQHSDGGPGSSSQATDDQDALSQSRDPCQDNPDHPGHQHERQGREAMGQLVNAGIPSKKLGKPGGTQRGGDPSERPLCHKCTNKPVDTKFLPCSHITSCHECAEQMLQCNNCKENIFAKVKA